MSKSVNDRNNLDHLYGGTQMPYDRNLHEFYAQIAGPENTSIHSANCTVSGIQFLLDD